MRKIAIITTRDFSFFADDDYVNQKVIDSITDWTEVSDEAYTALTKAADKRDWLILEQVKLPTVIKTVNDALNLIQRENDAKKQRKLALKQAKEAAWREQEHQHFKELQEKFSDDDMIMFLGDIKRTS